MGANNFQNRHKKHVRHGDASKLHPVLYTAWRNMNRRCYNENSDNYEYYGGRGITVCDEWRNSPGLFIDWSLGNGYSEKLQIDRINVNDGYSPDNCRWVDTYTQSHNKRVSKNNKTGFTGVDYLPKINKYRAAISRYGVRLYLGCFDDAKQAFAARQNALASIARP